MNVTVETFAMGTDKEAALKPLEEAAEVFGAFQTFLGSRGSCGMSITRAECVKWHGICKTRKDLADEIADCIQACCNLADRYDIDMQAAMERCERRNRERGRYE